MPRLHLGIHALCGVVMEDVDGRREASHDAR
jgi:hypothetical protein